MKRTVSILLIAATTVVVSSMVARSASAAGIATDRVVVMYFHRTQRCPTCMKMGNYSEEATKTGFAKQLKEGTVQFYLIDFQDKKNAALAKGYGITGPTLIVAKIVNNKVAHFTNLQEIWMKVRDEAGFLKYVQAQVTAYLQQLPKKPVAQ